MLFFHAKCVHVWNFFVFLNYICTKFYYLVNTYMYHYHTLQKLVLFWKVNDSNDWWKGKTEMNNFYHILWLFVLICLDSSIKGAKKKFPHIFEYKVISGSNKIRKDLIIIYVYLNSNTFLANHSSNPV